MESDNLNWSIEYYEENDAECNDTLKKLDDYSKIPLITKENIHHFKDGQMVRYQGMVQDMLNPEYYYPSYLVHNTISGEDTNRSGKYRDIAPCKENEELKLDGKVLDERLVFFCIPVPCTNSWVKNHMKSPSLLKNTVNHHSVNKKRAMEDEGEDEKMALDGEGTSEGPRNKRLSTVGNDAGISENLCHSSDKYFPLNEQDGLPCLVKIYEKEDNCGIVLNDRIEVIGFLSLHPALESKWEDSDAEDKALHPPPSLVPRVHALFTRKLVHTNPLLSQNMDSGEIIASADKARSDLHLTLTQVLYGDSLAADYLICHMLSRVYGRNEGQAVGKFSLNLCNLKSGSYTRRLYDMLGSLVTNSQYVPLSVESLNETSFVPKKDYETNRLWSGRLQMPDETHLVLDETGMSEGKLEHVGCLNVAALQNLIRDQEVNYDFSYYPVKYNTSIPVLVLSEGKSMFETDIRVKLEPDPTMTETINETFDAASFFLNGEVSQKIRAYLTCMRLQDFELSEEIMKTIGNDYVSLRQQKNDFGSSDLHNLLVLSRLLALSYGRTSLTLSDWSRALEMETERKNRLS